MIILRLRGGLGNQFFQYAAGKSLAQHHKTDFKLDLYYYKKHPYRKFELDKFNIPLSIASQEEIHSFTGNNPVTRFLNKRENYLRCPEVFAQPHYHFYTEWFHLPANLYLSGYFQSEKFFGPVREDLVKWFSPTRVPDGENARLHDQMASCESVSLHVRRGDYTARQFNTFFGTLPDEYYKKAVSSINERVSDPVFFVFSDDVAWCRENLKIGKAVFVEHNRGDDSYWDLLLMTRSKHNIIANSSFSWWGAWLNQNPSKIVISPRQWFNHDYFRGKESVYATRFYNTDDLIPSQWDRF